MKEIKMTAFMNPSLLASTGDGGSASMFVLLTLASVGLLCFLPAVWRQHTSKIGTYAHEVSHGVVSLLTGGEFHRFHVGEWGGVAVTSGGNRKAVAAAGYIGTIVLGAVFLARSAQADTLVVTLQVLAILLVLSTLKAGDLQTAAVGAAVAAFLGLFSTLFPTALPTRFLLNLMGVILIWQGARALWTLLVLSATTRGTGSDAEALARLTGRSALHWAVILGGLAFVVCLIVLRLGVVGSDSF
jgi:hypothetical protein